MTEPVITAQYQVHRGMRQLMISDDCLKIINHLIVLNKIINIVDS